MRILITGGAGFIGSHLAVRLIKKGHDIVVIDNLSTGKRTNVPAKADFLQLDLSKIDFLSHLPPGSFDAVCHLAAQSSGDISAKDPLHDVQTNAISTLLLSRWCQKNKIPRILYASSMSVYGNVPADRCPVREETPCIPLSYYGISKLTSEHLLRLANGPHLKSICLRMFSVYGPGQNLGNLKQGMVSIYLAYLLKGVQVPVMGSLDRYRDFIYIDDVIDAWERALFSSAIPSLAYNIGFGQPTTVRDLLALLLKITRLPPQHPIKEMASSSTDQFGLYADTRRAQRDLGWTPKTDLETGLRAMVKWAQAEPGHAG